jgi:mRNA interferase RelE/StbE
MPCELAFHPQALREWRQLTPGIREQFKNKLRAAGYRLVYEVCDHELLVLVVAVGKRERNVVYQHADQR